MMPRGRPKGTKYPNGIGNAIWQAVQIKRADGRHHVNRASELVAKDIAKHLPTWKMSGERIRHIYAAVEKRRASEPEFEKWTSENLGETRKGLEALATRKFVLLPYKLKALQGDAYILITLSKKPSLNLVK